MKYVLSILLSFLSVSFVYAQAGEWTWMNGDSAQFPTAHFGTQGVFNSLNTPPGLYESAEFTDKQGNFWLFGGGNNYADLWKFNPSINQWAWMKGPGVINTWGIYGTQGVPSPTNNPGARGWGITSWVDTTGNLWIYGGLGYDVNGFDNMMSDLWKYDISTNEWTWMKGVDTCHSTGHYGTMGVPDSANYPPCMWETNGSWTDANNNLWLACGSSDFGGLNDVWKYSIATNQWTWVRGSGIPTPSAIYGVQGIPNINNTPDGRAIYCKWKEDSNDNFWFFGGGYPQPRNDLWRYNISTNEWTWMSGDSVAYSNGALTTSECVPSTNNIPEARYENRACWKIDCDNIALFGGFSVFGLHSDLWNYHIPTDEWTLMKGDTSLNSPPIFGTKTISNPNNIPGATGGAISWKDNSGNLWLFGGYNGFGDRNTLWRFIPDTSCLTLCSETSVNEISDLQNEISIYPNPFSNELTVHTNSNELSEIILYDVASRKIMQHPFIKTVSLNTKQLARGLYLYEVQNKDGSCKKGKVVKD